MVNCGREGARGTSDQRKRTCRKYLLLVRVSCYRKRESRRALFTFVEGGLKEGRDEYTARVSVVDQTCAVSAFAGVMCSSSQPLLTCSDLPSVWSLLKPSSSLVFLQFIMVCSPCDHLSSRNLCRCKLGPRSHENHQEVLSCSH